MLHDEKYYPNPSAFDPDQFIPKDGKEAQPEPTFAFGFGRRICPGRHLAQNTTWIATASMVSTLSFSKALDSEGRTIKLSSAYTSEFVSFPLPLECRIKPRSAAAQALLD
ncbi:cytochrome P450-like protein [Armillaria novae-zelandiae]|uniref:Cytochrome P450-like protein n=1 Tax=Armillaria novae-zelandiae TaxID=153914 RepID=A0AA39P976_9AGAR|nr:cytochrome P450-like protein [Armillaria novae-zelandiae]